MNSKIVVFLSTIFPAKKPIQTVQPTTVPTLGSPITQNQPRRASDDFSHMFQGF